MQHILCAQARWRCRGNMKVRAPRGRGRFSVLRSGRLLLAASAQPLLDGARPLLAQESPADGTIVMRREVLAHPDALATPRRGQADRTILAWNAFRSGVP
jgi:hypothetical protein